MNREHSQICRGMGQSMKRKGQILEGQNQSICSGTFPSSTPSLMLIKLVSSPLQWVNPPCPQEKVPAKAPSLADPQQVLTYSPTRGLLLRFAPMGTPSNTSFTPGGSPTAPHPRGLPRCLHMTPESLPEIPVSRDHQTSLGIHSNLSRDPELSPKSLKGPNSPRAPGHRETCKWPRRGTHPSKTLKVLYRHPKNPFHSLKIPK